MSRKASSDEGKERSKRSRNQEPPNGFRGAVMELLDNWLIPELAGLVCDYLPPLHKVVIPSIAVKSATWIGGGVNRWAVLTESKQVHLLNAEGADMGPLPNFRSRHIEELRSHGTVLVALSSNGKCSYADLADGRDAKVTIKAPVVQMNRAALEVRDFYVGPSSLSGAGDDRLVITQIIRPDFGGCQQVFQAFLGDTNVTQTSIPLPTSHLHTRQFAGVNYILVDGRALVRLEPVDGLQGVGNVFVVRGDWPSQPIGLESTSAGLLIFMQNHLSLMTGCQSFQDFVPDVTDGWGRRGGWAVGFHPGFSCFYLLKTT